MEDFKEKDRKAIITYLTGKDAVRVDDIISNAGAESLRVYSLLHEMYLEGVLEYVKSGIFGAPEIVKLK